MRSKRIYKKAYVVLKESRLDDIDCVPSTWLVYDDDDEPEEDEDRRFVDYRFPSRKKVGKGVIFSKDQPPNKNWPIFSGKVVLDTNYREEAVQLMKTIKARNESYELGGFSSDSDASHFSERDFSDSTNDSESWEEFLAVKATINGKEKYDVIPKSWVLHYEPISSSGDQDNSDEPNVSYTVTYRFPSLKYLGKEIRFAKNLKPKVKWTVVTGEKLAGSDQREALFNRIADYKKKLKLMRGNTHGSSTESDSEEEITPGPSGSKRKVSEQKKSKKTSKKIKFWSAKQNKPTEPGKYKSRGSYKVIDDMTPNEIRKMWNKEKIKKIN